jgi:hypothetical protein
MSFGGMGGSDGSELQITGGYLVINAEGDGIDSNGTVTMSGGTVLVYGPTNGGNGAIDYDQSFELTGGTLLAVGASTMAQAPSSSTQYLMSVGLDQTLQAGSYLCISSADEQYVVQLPKSADHIVFSSPNLKQGETYTISYGGDFDGTLTDSYAENAGTYSGGTAMTELTLSDTITTYGAVGVGGSGGGMMFGQQGQQGGFSGGFDQNNGDDTTSAPSIPDGIDFNGSMPDGMEIPSGGDFDGSMPDGMEIPSGGDFDGSMPDMGSMPDQGSAPDKPQ